MVASKDIIIFYNEMVDLAFVDLPPGGMAKGKKNILEAMINEWKIVLSNSF